jgi:hypothetical protein
MKTQDARTPIGAAVLWHLARSGIRFSPGALAGPVIETPEGFPPYELLDPIPKAHYHNAQQVWRGGMQAEQTGKYLDAIGQYKGFVYMVTEWVARFAGEPPMPPMDGTADFLADLTR